MKLSTTYELDFGEKSLFYVNLLKEEDFDFKTKSVVVKISQKNSKVFIEVFADSLLELKVGTSSVMKSLEIISKTLNLNNKNECTN